MKNIVRILSLVLAAMMLCGMVGTVASAEGVVELTIPHYKAGENVGAVFFLPQVERFNKLYEGKYHITIEELTGDLYAEKMKQLGQQNALPALVEGGETEWIQNVVIPNGLYTDLSGFLADHPDVAALLDETALAYNTTEDNKVFSISLPVIRPMGMYYNGALLDLGDKTAADLSWDEFAEKLGDNKIAFMTGENAWTTALIFSSLIAVEEGGADLLRETYSTKIYDYNQPAILNAVTKLQALLQNYAASNRGRCVRRRCQRFRIQQRGRDRQRLLDGFRLPARRLRQLVQRF